MRHSPFLLALLTGCVAITDFERDPPDAAPPATFDAAVGDAYAVPQADAFPMSGLEELDPETRAECAGICEHLEACAFDESRNEDWTCDPHPDNRAYGLNACVGFCAASLRNFQSATLIGCSTLQTTEGINDLMQGTFCVPDSLCLLLCAENAQGVTGLEACGGFTIGDCRETCGALPDPFWACVAQDLFLTFGREELAEGDTFATLLCQYVAICLPE